MIKLENTENLTGISIIGVLNTKFWKKEMRGSDGSKFIHGEKQHRKGKSI